MMEKEFVPYNEALELKQLGFDEPCFGYYEPNGDFNYIESNILKNFPYLAKNSEWKDLCGAPTYSQALSWFREKRGMKFHIRQDIWNNWCKVKMILENDEYVDIDEFESYEKAELACLRKLIEIVKNK